MICWLGSVMLYSVNHTTKLFQKKENWKNGMSFVAG